MTLKPAFKFTQRAPVDQPHVTLEVDIARLRPNGLMFDRSAIDAGRIKLAVQYGRRSTQGPIGNAGPNGAAWETKHW